jgi:Mce-associated membrane protein
MAVTTHQPGRSVTGEEGVTKPAGFGTASETVDNASAAESGKEQSRESAADRPSRKPQRLLVPTAIGLILMLLVVLVCAVIFGSRAAAGFNVEDGRASALAAGRQAAIDLTTFDFGTAEADVQRLKDSTTPNFENGFASDKDSFVRFLRDGKVKMTGDVTEAGVLSYGGKDAQVLVAIKSQISNNLTPQPQVRNYRMDVSMVYQDGRWLANAAEFIA